MKILNCFESILFPTLCLLCQVPLGWAVKGLCQGCQGKIQRLEGKGCILCGKSVPEFSQKPRCSECRQMKRSFRKGVCHLKYNRALGKLIRLMKYKGRVEGLFILQVITSGWSRSLKKQLPPLDLVTSIPMTYTEAFKRPIQLSPFLAKSLARELDVPFRRILRKYRRTSPQSRLRREKRLHNLEKAFNVRVPSAVKNKVILVVDDIFTTGATFEVVARSLKEMGARQVYVAALARSGRYENT